MGLKTSVMDDMVMVPRKDAEFLDELRAMSKRGHSADALRYVERDKEWVYLEDSGKKRKRKKVD